MIKKVTLLLSAMAISCGMWAQPDVAGDNERPIKLDDVVAAYKAGKYAAAEEQVSTNRGKIYKEDRDYHFQRWLWYWQAHTDTNGYLVPQTKIYDEWRKMHSRNSQLKTTAGNNSNWSFEGPTTSTGGYAGLGRINEVAFHPTNANTYYVATAGGGVWRTANNGQNWTSLTDNFLVLGTSDIDVNPKNPNTLYVCTGDRDASDSYSIGVFKSYDGGQTWDTTGLKWNTPQMRLTNCLLINPVDTNSLTLATSAGIYKSYNGGTTWVNRQAGHFKQLLYHPTDTNIVYATTYNTGSGAAIYRSSNGGYNWSLASVSGLPNNARRITIATTPANVAVVKAVVANSNGGLNGIYNSTDTGKTFTRIFGPPSGGSRGCGGDLISGTLTTNLSNVDCGNQGWYDLTIAVSPTNADLVYVGGVNTYRSTNGGSNWSIVNAWAGLSGVTTVHADKHHHIFHPLLPNRLFECNDGGIYYCDNPAATSIWQHVTNGMGITQFYRNAVANNVSLVVAGAQDNGTKGVQGGNWDDISGGDGMDCQIDPVDSDYFYTGVQNGVIYSYSQTSGYIDNISGNIPGNPTGGWITPYIISPFDNQQLIAGYKLIYWTSDRGMSWYPVTPDALDNGKYILRVAMTPASDSTIYAVLSNSNKVYYTHKFDPTQVSSGNTVKFDSLTSPYSGSISDIKVDARDRNHFWITYSGFNGTKVAEYKSGTWTAQNGGLPNVAIHCVEVDSATDIRYVGTDLGVFYMDTATAPNWSPFNTNLPSIEVTDLGINYGTKELWASTYGRGLWKTMKQVYEPDTSGGGGSDTTDTTDTTIVVTLIPYKVPDFKIVPNPSRGRFAVTMSDAGNKPVTITIRDNMGRLVLSRRQTFAKGAVEIDADGLAKGVYILELADGDRVYGRQRVVLNE